jgi:hypothetical protein
MVSGTGIASDTVTPFHPVVPVVIVFVMTSPQASPRHYWLTILVRSATRLQIPMSPYQSGRPSIAAILENLVMKNSVLAYGLCVCNGMRGVTNG